MHARGERRKTTRIKTHFESLFSQGRTEGAGVLRDISYTGAQVAEASSIPEIGEQVHLYVFVQPINPFQVSGTVVRHLENGFAIEYKDIDKDIRHLVDDAAAIVKLPQ